MKYYEINEGQARRAHDMMSSRDYREGSKTDEYQRQVDETYALAEKVAKARPDQAERVYNLADRYARKLADNMNAESRIGCMCPSIMISGGGNFPVKKKEKQVAALDRNRQEWNEIQNIRNQLESILNGKNIVKSGDANAVQRLEEKLERLKESQKMMKAVNAYYRKNKTLDGCELIAEGTRNEIMTNMERSWRAAPKPFESYELTNNNANIHRIEKRIEELKAAKQQDNTESEYEGFKVIENTEMMRLQIVFDGKPDADVRAILKSNGFRWAPSQGAWQRHLNSNGKYALKRVLEQLEQ